MIEYRGSAIRALSMEGRMTICNMSIEAGARAGMVAPDDTTFAYLEGKPHAPSGADWERALDDWRSLPTTRRVVRRGGHDRRHRAPSARVVGHEPGQSVTIDDAVPEPDSFEDEAKRDAARRALAYMALEPGTRIRDIRPDTSSSAPARTRGSRTCAWPPGSSRVAAWPRDSARWSCPARSP